MGLWFRDANRDVISEATYLGNHSLVVRSSLFSPNLEMSVFLDLCNSLFTPIYPIIEYCNSNISNMCIGYLGIASVPLVFYVSLTSHFWETVLGKDAKMILTQNTKPEEPKHQLNLCYIPSKDVKNGYDTITLFDTNEESAAHLMLLLPLYRYRRIEHDGVHGVGYQVRCTYKSLYASRLGTFKHDPDTSTALITDYTGNRLHKAKCSQNTFSNNNPIEKVRCWHGRYYGVRLSEAFKKNKDKSLHGV